MGFCHAERRKASRFVQRWSPFAPLKVARVTVEAEVICAVWICIIEKCCTY
jgi:hypothetical protein